MHWTQTLLAVALVVYVGAFVAAMVVVRRSTGASPRGHAGGHHLAALLNGVAALLMLVTAIAYPLDARSVDWFRRLPFLDHPLWRGFGAAALVVSGVCLIWGEVSLGRGAVRAGWSDHHPALVLFGLVGIFH